MHAAVLGFWSVQIPAVAHHARLHDGQLGLALAAEPIGSGLVMLGAGALVQRFGSARVLRAVVVPYAAATAAVGLATSLSTAAVALGLWGATMAVLNIAMNTQGLVVEAAIGHGVLVKLHGWWSLGAFAGAALGSGLGAVNFSVTARMTVAALAALVVMAAASLALLPGTGDDDPVHRRGLVRPDAWLLGLSFIAFCSLLCEGAVLTWSALFLTDTVHVTAWAAGLGYAGFALAMCAGRLCGDRVFAAVGTARGVVVASACAAIAIFAGLYAVQAIVTIASFALLGLGLSCVMPVVTRVAGTAKGVPAAPAIALVSSSGWVGVVAGPPLIGWVASLSSLRTALGALVVLPALIAVLTPALLVRRGTASDRDVAAQGADVDVRGGERECRKSSAALNEVS